MAKLLTLEGGEHMTSKRMLTASIIAAFGLAIMTSSAVFAQSETGDKGMNSIVQQIAHKFNLKESDVQAVFDEEHKVRTAEMHEKFETNLTNLVSKGSITEEQKQKILAKKKELSANKPKNLTKFKNMTPNQRKTEMEKQKTELEAWAKDNGIDLSKIPFFIKINGHGGHGGRKMFQVGTEK